ncbi:hypothetical protein B0T24DRAFT_427213 [Lasiosphaeria ovina]|uniref:Uncharacterized protein n=1 Tax=Lasiosphaeria ovina TaxID=92902 RepID=A0AAE0JVL8_9PEZI|nr:hypothetical protein B0T24DRAFT_427213 [Lasiosphaeria ovina]
MRRPGEFFKMTKPLVWKTGEGAADTTATTINVKMEAADPPSNAKGKSTKRSASTSDDDVPLASDVRRAYKKRKKLGKVVQDELDRMRKGFDKMQADFEMRNQKQMNDMKRKFDGWMKKRVETDLQTSINRDKQIAETMNELSGVLRNGISRVDTDRGAVSAPIDSLAALSRGEESSSDYVESHQSEGISQDNDMHPNRRNRMFLRSHARACCSSESDDSEHY